MPYILIAFMQMRMIPEQVFAHAVQDDLISRKQLQRLFVTVKEVLNATHRVQLLCPFEESEPEGLLKGRCHKSSSKIKHLFRLYDCGYAWTIFDSACTQTGLSE